MQLWRFMYYDRRWVRSLDEAGSEHTQNGFSPSFRWARRGGVGRCYHSASCRAGKRWPGQLHLCARLMPALFHTALPACRLPACLPSVQGQGGGAGHRGWRPGASVHPRGSRRHPEDGLQAGKRPSGGRPGGAASGGGLGGVAGCWFGIGMAGCGAQQLPKCKLNSVSRPSLERNKHTLQWP